MIQQFPELQPLYDEKHRFAVLRRYPYSIIYRVEGERIRVIAFTSTETSWILAGQGLSRF